MINNEPGSGIEYQVSSVEQTIIEWQMTMASWKSYTQLLKKNKRAEQQRFLVEGVRLCQEALNSAWEIEAIFLSESFLESAHYLTIENLLQQQAVPVTVIADGNLKKLCDTQTPQGIVLVVRQPVNGKMSSEKPPRFVLLLDGIRDPGNLGTLIRSAHWFGVDAIFCSADCVDPYNGKVLRSTMGSIFHVPIFGDQDLKHVVQSLREKGMQILASSLNSSDSMDEITISEQIGLILGGEAQGVSRELETLADSTVRIPPVGSAESLNVSVAGGIFMHQMAKHLFGVS